MKEASNNNIVKGMASYFTKVKKIILGQSEIDFLILNIPPICNYRCKKCFTNASLRKIRDPLTLDELQYLIREGKKLGAKNVSILGEGEPLIYKDIKKIINYIDTHGMIPMIATNARMLTPRMADFLFENNVTVGFSLDTLNKGEYNRYCGGNADFAKVMRNIQYVRKLFAKDIRIQNGYMVYRFVLHMTVTPKNIHQVNKLKDFCGEDIFFDCQPLACVGVAGSNLDYFGKKNNYEQFSRYGHMMYVPMVLTQTELGHLVCCLFYYGMAINYSGDVMFDTHAIEPQNCIGNIRNVSMPVLLSRLKKLREYFIKYFKYNYCPIREKTFSQFIKASKQIDLNLLWPESNRFKHNK